MLLLTGVKGKYREAFLQVFVIADWEWTLFCMFLFVFVLFILFIMKSHFLDIFGILLTDSLKVTVITCFLFECLGFRKWPINCYINNAIVFPYICNYNPLLKCCKNKINTCWLINALQLRNKTVSENSDEHHKSRIAWLS